MNQTIFKKTVRAALLATTATIVACSAPAQSAVPETGELSLALRSSSGGSDFELDGAIFHISGAAELELQADGAEQALEQELPVGDYSLELQDGWQLLRISEDGSETLSATLVSENPRQFSINEGETTSISYRFEFDGDEIELGTGFVSITIDVAKATARSVIFNEVMSNPAELGDTAGEWIELQNVGNDSVELQGCVVERDATAFEITEPLLVETGQAVALANGDAPGFVPDYVYSGVTLPNSAVFVLTLRCDDEVLDTVTVDPSVWPGAAGVSASLSPGNSAQSNDDPSNWCNATAAYNTDLGTPGEPNPPCAL